MRKEKVQEPGESINPNEQENEGGGGCLPFIVRENATCWLYTRYSINRVAIIVILDMNNYNLTPMWIAATPKVRFSYPLPGT